MHPASGLSDGSGWDETGTEIRRPSRTVALVFMSPNLASLRAGIEPEVEDSLQR